MESQHLTRIDVYVEFIFYTILECKLYNSQFSRKESLIRGNAKVITRNEEVFLSFHTLKRKYFYLYATCRPLSPLTLILVGILHNLFNCCLHCDLSYPFLFCLFSNLRKRNTLRSILLRISTSFAHIVCSLFRHFFKFIYL